MKTQKQHGSNLLVLVPHRDIRLVVRNYSAALFKAGFSGAYLFPWVVPLAVLSSPLTNDELKQMAEKREWEKISITEGTMTAFPQGGDNVTIFGPRIDSWQGVHTPSLQGGVVDFLSCIHNTNKDNGETLNNSIIGSLDNTSRLKIQYAFSQTVIGACILTTGEDCPAIPPPQLSFCAAAFANMQWQPVSLGYKWKIGKLCWLPKKSVTAKHTYKPGTKPG